MPALASARAARAVGMLALAAAAVAGVAASASAATSSTTVPSPAVSDRGHTEATVSPSTKDPAATPGSGGGPAEPAVSGALRDPGRPAALQARREDVSDTIHGVRVADPYRWLENVDDPDVRAWLGQQDALAREGLGRLAVRDALRARFTELYYIEDHRSPLRRARRWFYLRRDKKQEKAVLYWRAAESGEERVLFDPNTASTDGSIALGRWSASRDGRYVAYTLHRNNSDRAVLRVREVDSGKDLEKDVIEDAKYGSASWTPDSRGFYYTWLPADPSIKTSELPGYMDVRFHVLGTDPKSDVVIHPALHDPTRAQGADLSHDGRWLTLVKTKGWTSNDLWVKDFQASGAKPASAPASDAGNAAGAASVSTSVSSPPTPESLGFTPIAVGKDARYSLIAWKGAFYVATNEGAPRYRVFRVDPAHPDRAGWKEIVPESDATLEDVSIIGGRLLLTYLDKAASRLEIRELDGRFVRRVDLPGIGHVTDLTGEPDQDEAFFKYESFTQTPVVLRTSLSRGATRRWKAVDYPADTTAMTVEQVFYPSRDGTRISMFLVHRKDMVRSGENPTLLYGYGGFNQVETPTFLPSVVVWLEHGGVFAVPNLRGGGEYGEDWHRAGMLERKQNVFDDFIAAAEYLVASKITRPGRLGISGGSNGGLLVGAAMVQRPELFKAVVCAVPLIDMVRYHLFGAGKTWVQEYGSADDPSQFRALLAYSPYHHVAQGVAYPAVLMLSADSDDRVDPMHARKFTAALQWATGGSSPVWLRIQKHSGHAGADLVRETVDQKADTYAFLIDQLGAR